jgi:hypothetical protein
MDFSGVDAAVRLVLFAALFASLALVAAWSLLRQTSDSRLIYQVLIAAGAIAAIPAVIAAPVEDGTWLNVLAIVAVGGCAASILGAGAYVAQEESAAVGGGIRLGRPTQRGSSAAPLAPASVTRVGSAESMTAVSSSPMTNGDQTLVHKADEQAASRVAFLVEYSGDGTPHRLGSDTIVGRNREAGISVDDTEVSKEHVRVKFENERFVLYDLGSTNGTRLLRAGRRRRITSPTLLNDSDIIIVGQTQLAFLELEG